MKIKTHMEHKKAIAQKSSTTLLYATAQLSLIYIFIILILLIKILGLLFYEAVTWSLSTEQLNNIRVLIFLNQVKI